MLRHYCLESSEELGAPYHLFEVRLEIQDIRSGYRGSHDAWYEAPWLREEDSSWPRDGVCKIDRGTLVAIAPPEQSIEWPDFADDRIVRHFLSSPCISVWKNFELSLYSGPLESEEEFEGRCISAVSDERREELEKIRDVFLRRFLEIEQKTLISIEEGAWGAKIRDQHRSHIHEMFSGLKENFSQCFLRDDFEPISESDLEWKATVEIEYQERLDALRSEFVAQYNAVNQRCALKSSQIEAYEVPLDYSQIEVVSTAILWR